MMNGLKIVHTNGRFYSDKMDRLSLLMDKIGRHRLQYSPWPSYRYKPSVEFSIAYNANDILLKFFVAESSIRAAVGEINGPVWKDSCVELFIAFDDNRYYNFEFNCIGTVLGGFGPGRLSREGLPEKALRRIKFQSQIQNVENGINWELTVMLPVKVFLHHDLASLRGRRCRLNFYKCGDELPQPHYLAWSNIESDEPNFHLPQFFGEAFFD